MSESKQVFLSHCVRSTGKEARNLNEILEQRGFSTFNCVGMEAGSSFRDEIIRNACTCKVMVVFMDKAWSDSMECASEFKCALSAYHKNTIPNIIPIVIGGFGWIEPDGTPLAFLVTASFQCLPVPENHDETHWESVFEQVLKKCEMLIRPIQPLISPATNIPLSTSNQQISRPQSQDEFSIISNFLTCEICYEFFDDPKLMPCNHTFCAKCLVDWKEKCNNGFNCPKCRSSCLTDISALKSDFKANQLLDAYKQQQSRGNRTISRGDTSVADGVDTATAAASSVNDLTDWFRKFSIQEEVQKELLDHGFDSLDSVLDIEETDLQEIKLKFGHRKKLMKSIRESKSEKVGGSRADGEDAGAWQILDDLYDDRVLRSGTDPADSLKFWLSFTKEQRENFIQRIKCLGSNLIVDTSKGKEQRARRLHQTAMILCDVAMYGDAKDFATEALSLSRDNNREFYKTKLLWVHISLMELKLPKFIRKNSAHQFKQLIVECDTVLLQGKNYLSEEMLLKTMILKLFSIVALIRRDKAYKPDKHNVSLMVAEAESICDKIEEGEGLRAELVMTFTLYKVEIRMIQSAVAVKEYLKARKLCGDTYGEISVLMARIYHNLGCVFETMKLSYHAYECFRRIWLVYKQIYGPHHVITKKVASVIEEERTYSKIALELKDTLPSDDHIGHKDLEFMKRLQIFDKYT